ncbi:hypothetical protein CHR28_36510 [Streptomyces sp. XY006]|nr:hypothetical protein CHR28_36510 [Streptomyces sp. XY006]
MPLRISFTPGSRRDVGAGHEKAGEAGRIDLATPSATGLRYEFFEHPGDFTVDGHAFLSAVRPFDFTENSYVIRLQLVGHRV